MRMMYSQCGSVACKGACDRCTKTSRSSLADEDRCDKSDTEWAKKVKRVPGKRKGRPNQDSDEGIFDGIKPESLNLLRHFNTQTVQGSH